MSWLQNAEPREPAPLHFRETRKTTPPSIIKNDIGQLCLRRHFECSDQYTDIPILLSEPQLPAVLELLANSGFLEAGTALHDTKGNTYILKATGYLQQALPVEA